MVIYETCCCTVCTNFGCHCHTVHYEHIHKVSAYFKRLEKSDYKSSVQTYRSTVSLINGALRCQQRSSNRPTSYKTLRRVQQKYSLAFERALPDFMDRF